MDLGPMLERRGTTPDDSRPIYCEELRREYGLELFSLTEGSWKIIKKRRREGEPQFHLYDLETDPGERHDRASTEHPRLRLLMAKLRRYSEGLAAGATEVKEGKAQELDEATRQQLEALGYGAP